MQDELAAMKAAEVKRERLVADVSAENRALAEPLAAAQAETAALRAALDGAERDRTALVANKARLAAAERANKALAWECEVLHQQLEGANARGKALEGAFRGAVADAAQRGALRSALLERKLSTVASVSMAGCSGGKASSSDSQASPAHSVRSSSSSSPKLTATRTHMQTPCFEFNVTALQSTAAVLAAATNADQPLPVGLPSEPRTEPAESPAPQASGEAPAIGSVEWALAMLAAAVRTPLPDPDAELVEEEEAALLLGAIEAMGAGDVCNGPLTDNVKASGVDASDNCGLLGELSEKLSAGAVGSAAAGTGDTILAIHTSQQL